MQKETVQRQYSRDCPDPQVKGKWKSAISIVNGSKQEQPPVDIVIPKHVSKNDFVKWGTRVDAAHVRQIEQIALQHNYELLQKSMAVKEVPIKSNQQYKTKFKWKKIVNKAQSIDADQESLNGLSAVNATCPKMVLDMMQPKFELLVPLKVGEEQKIHKNQSLADLKNSFVEEFYKKKSAQMRRASGGEGMAMFAVGENPFRRKSEDRNLYNTIKSNLPSTSTTSVLSAGVLANKYKNRLYKYFKS